MTVKIEIDCPCGHSTIFEIKDNIINEFICESCKTHLAYLGPHYTMKFYDKKFPVDNWRVVHEPIRIPIAVARPHYVQPEWTGATDTTWYTSSGTASTTWTRV